MLADDPDLRPQSMAEIAESLQRIEELPELAAAPAEPPAPAPAPPAGLVRRLQQRVRLLAAAVAVIVAVGVLSWFTLDRDRRDAESTLEGYANRYARSVGFVLVDYWLESDGARVFRNVAEGTAFLVDRDGYLLTSRHVVCPWLEDPRFLGVVQYARSRALSLTMGYRVHLWFEGTRAFNPAGRMMDSPDITDIYFTENAYSTDGSPRVEIAGVAKPPVRTRQLFKSPLKDDFAVIKIDRMPEGLVPLPLDLEMDPGKLPKLSRVIALGFPLGSRTQLDTVNASVVRGNVRRAFENMFQIDASLHGGNSGGPVIDTRGRVIGIVSAVAMDFSQGLVPIATPVWDIGLILPITGAERLLRDLKAGHAKWNGVIDFTAEAALAKIRETAAQGRWAEAMAAVDEKLGRSLQPAGGGGRGHAPLLQRRRARRPAALHPVAVHGPGGPPGAPDARVARLAGGEQKRDALSPRTGRGRLAQPGRVPGLPAAGAGGPGRAAGGAERMDQLSGKELAPLHRRPRAPAAGRPCRGGTAGRAGGALRRSRRLGVPAGPGQAGRDAQAAPRGLAGAGSVGRLHRAHVAVRPSGEGEPGREKEAPGGARPPLGAPGEQRCRRGGQGRRLAEDR